MNRSIVEASRRIYFFEFISDLIIGESAETAKWLALTFVGSGFKTLGVMLVLTFWSLTCLIFGYFFSFIYGLFGGT